MKYQSVVQPDGSVQLVPLEDSIFDLAKELFLKSYRPQLFLNDESIKQYNADINNAIVVAEMFVKRFEEHEAKNN